ncbi:TPA: hypothetical protein DCQ44_00040 [Candidatus Taylorbacteria bacterium]|nr:hypothetical protein [Candidatus Taylorbacteria bacterium]
MTFMGSPLFLNPFYNPIFFDIIWRIVLGFALGFVLIWALNKFKLKGIWSSKVGLIYLGWLVLLPLYVVGIFFGWVTGMAVVFLFMFLAIWEIVRIGKIPKVYGYLLSALALITVVIAAFFTSHFVLLPLFFFATIAFTSVRRNDAEKGFYYAAVAVYVSIWIIFGLAHIELLAHLNGQLDNTSSLLFLIVFAVTLSDIGAYIFGKLFHHFDILDQYKIASNLSPNKTYIGILGHIIGAAAGVWVMQFAVASYMPWYHWIIISVLIGVFGSSGGMMNSMFKRYYGVKDSNSLIPGHGGALDRIDSTIRVLIVIYYYFSFFLLK